jgi:NAD(P)-dependent dehydrogenase (short-subunit alcohol dehydrogenase family)
VRLHIRFLLLNKLPCRGVIVKIHLTMKYRSLLLACLMFAGICLFACKPSDSKLQQAVNEKMTATPGVSATVQDGVATLSGEVTDESARQTAEDAAKNVKGIKSVVNNITVQAPPPPPTPPVAINPDDMLKKTLDSAFGAAGYTGVTVSVSNGEVTLDGTAKKADLRKIMQTAQEAKPKKVNNNLKLQ